ncbi:MAG: Uma2 family endonuclease [bacterium]|nr:Uma2 family endonuclease [bacterium]
MEDSTRFYIEIQGETVFYYPDVLVSCADEGRDACYREQPCLIVKALSKSTRRQDRFEKFMTYKDVPSLQEYLILEQEYRAARSFAAAADEGDAAKAERLFFRARRLLSKKIWNSKRPNNSRVL